MSAFLHAAKNFSIVFFGASAETTAPSAFPSFAISTSISPTSRVFKSAITMFSFTSFLIALIARTPSDLIRGVPTSKIMSFSFGIFLVSSKAEFKFMKSKAI